MDGADHKKSAMDGRPTPDRQIGAGKIMEWEGGERGIGGGGEEGAFAMGRPKKFGMQVLPLHDTVQTLQNVTKQGNLRSNQWVGGHYDLCQFHKIGPEVD